MRSILSRRSKLYSKEQRPQGGLFKRSANILIKLCQKHITPNRDYVSGYVSYASRVMLLSLNLAVTECDCFNIVNSLSKRWPSVWPLLIIREE